MEIRNDRLDALAAIDDLRLKKNSIDETVERRTPKGAEESVDFELSDAAKRADAAGIRLFDAQGLIPPTLESVQRLSAELAPKLAEFFEGHAIEIEPPLQFAIEPNGKLTLLGDRPDKEKILETLATNTRLERNVRNATVIAGVAYELHNGGHLEFQRDYRASNDPAAVVANYSYLFDRRPASQFALTYGQDGLGYAADGKPWKQASAS